MADCKFLDKDGKHALDENDIVRLETAYSRGMFKAFVYEIECGCEHTGYYILNKWLLLFMTAHKHTVERLGKLDIDEQLKIRWDLDQLNQILNFLRMRSRPYILTDLTKMKFPVWHPFYNYWAMRRYDGLIPDNYFSPVAVAITVIAHDNGYSKTFICEEARRAVLRGDALSDAAEDLPLDDKDWAAIAAEYCESMRVSFTFMQSRGLTPNVGAFETNMDLLKRLSKW